MKESNIEIFNFVVFPVTAGDLAALRSRRGLRFTSYSSFNSHHLWLHFSDASSHSRYMTELTAGKKQRKLHVLHLNMNAVTFIKIQKRNE